MPRGSREVIIEFLRTHPDLALRDLNIACVFLLLSRQNGIARPSCW